MKILVTGGAGFIGSEAVRQLVEETEDEVVVLDKLTYAGSLDALGAVADNPRLVVERVDIADAPAVFDAFARHRPDAVIHLAAESHVDRSIDGPADFIETNIVGTFTLLQATRDHLRRVDPADRLAFRFLHVSTDEVYGSLGPVGAFTEETPYAANSPYSASKAASDHLVRAWHHTYGLPTLVTNCSNNYGPRQFPEKLIPLMIAKALAGQPLPVYGSGENVRDWLHVEDHVRALRAVLASGRVGQTYNVGGGAERTNLQLVSTLCALLDELAPDSSNRPHSDLITFVPDRPGHDFRYAIDARKIREELGWRPRWEFNAGLRQAVLWYLRDAERSRSAARSDYRGERLGLGCVTR